MAETQVGRIERAHAKEYVTTYEAGRVFEDGGAEDFLTEGAIRKYNKQLSDQKIESLQGPLSGGQRTYGHQYEVYHAPPADPSNVTSKMIYRPVIRKLAGTGAGIINHQFQPVGAVAFPLPQGLVDMVKPQWEQGSAQIKGAMKAAGKAAIAGGAGALTGAAVAAPTGFGAIIGAKVGAVFGLATSAGNIESFISSLTAGKVGIGSEASKQRNAIVNTHEEQYFKGLDFRSFTFTHKLVATTEQESLAISGVVDFLQKWASRRFKNRGTHIEYPAEFRINFLHGGQTNRSLPVINQCVCEGIDINYSPDGNQFFETGAPTSVEIVMNMKEAILRTRDHIVTQEMEYSQQVRALQTREMGEKLGNRDYMRGVTNLEPEQYTGGK